MQERQERKMTKTRKRQQQIVARERKRNSKMSFIRRKVWNLRPELDRRVTCLMVLVFALAQFNPVEPWRIFDTNAETRSFGTLDPNNNMLIPNYQQAPINLPTNNQLIIPSTSTNQMSNIGSGSVNSGSAANQPESIMSSTMQNKNAATNEQAQNADAAASSLTLSLTDSEIQNANARSDLARDASLLSAADAAVSQVVDAIKASRSEHDNNQAEAAASQSVVVPSPAGKIIGHNLSAALGTNGSGLVGAHNSSASDSVNKQINVAFQLLKPRYSQDTNRQLASAEQQIINQHASVHPVGNSHHRLLPTKQRDNRIHGALIDSTTSGSSAGNSEREPLSLYSLLGDFKSGISSRNSIAKAISDNKLARTLSTVGKSISGNKYVVGAAAASALAALGLTVSHLLAPYLGYYIKLGGPTMSSGTVSSPSMASDLNGARTDQSFLYTSPVDSMLTAASSQQAVMRPQQMGASYPTTVLDPTNLYDAASDTVALQQHQATTDLFQKTIAYPGSYSSQGASESQIYLTYRPTTMNPPQYQFIKPATSSSAGTGGHYTDFYEQQGISSPGSSSSISQYETSYDRSTSSPSSSLSLSTTTSASSPLLPSRYSQNQASSSSAISMAQIDQMMPAASIESPTFPNSQQRPTNNMDSGSSGFVNQAYAYMPASQQPGSISSAPRRSGTVTLRMDQATKNRIAQTLWQQRQLQQPLLIPTFSDEFGAGGDSISGQVDKFSSNNFATSDSFVPMTTTTPAAMEDGSTSSGSEYVTGSVKSGRAETGENKNHHASSMASKPQQGQQVPKTAATYMLIRPKTNEPDSYSGEKQKTTTEANGTGLVPNQKQAQARQSPWRSFDGETQQQSQSQQQQQQSQTVEETSRQISGGNPVGQQHQPLQQWRLPTSDDQQQVSQASQLASGRVIGAATATDANVQQQQRQEVPLQRVSRTPNQSSVKQQPSAAAMATQTTTTTSVPLSYPPIESLTDYDFETLNGANEVRSSLGASELAATKERQPSAISVASNQKLASVLPSSTEGAESSPAAKTNLIQLDDGDKNNVIKLTEANTKGSDKLASVADSVLTVSGNRVSYIPRNEGDVTSAMSEDGQRERPSQQHHHRKQQQSQKQTAAGQSIEITGKSAMTAAAVAADKDEVAESLRIYSGSLTSGSLVR